ncbi:MAG: VapC toxin family PIN domain ribonuclease [Deltaproteobacteria bacterium]|nr:VapC toxin family PIN domain ribonuclease [Deltaproteobacteria bacterium]
MSACLLDLNALLALAWPNHVHHRPAHAWFASHPDRFATCPLTQCGFVRLSSNLALTPDAVAPLEALELLARICRLDRHEFWADDVDLGVPEAVPASLLLGHQQVTDAYLLGLAIHHRGRLATFDHGVLALLPTDDPRRGRIEIIPV